MDKIYSELPLDKQDATAEVQGQLTGIFYAVAVGAAIIGEILVNSFIKVVNFLSKNYFAL